MNKHVIYSLITTALISFSYAVHAQDYFSQLEPQITKKAATWIEQGIRPLTHEQQQVVLNIFGLKEITQETIVAVTQQIQVDKALENVFDLLQTDINAIIQMYIAGIEKKLSSHKSATSNMDEFYKQLETKIIELYAYINTVYYTLLYSYMEKNVEPRYRMCMFNEKGIIPVENRTQLIATPL